MLNLISVVIAMMLGLFGSIIISFIILPILRRKKANQRISIYLESTHSKKKNVPTMGGLIFILPPLIITLVLILMGKMPFSYNLLTLIFVFLGYSLIGFIDDFLIIIKNNNKGLSENAKLVFQIIMAIIFFYLFLLGDNEPLIWIHTLNIKIDIGWFYGLFILLVLVSSSNAVNITDGLDGLAGGLSLIALLTFGIITLNTGWLEGYAEISLFIFMICGSLIGFLFFNSNPAKIFMGDTGSLALGATLGSIAILTRHEILLIVIGVVFVLETLSCVIQRVYYKITHKRIFPITPIHHTFERIMNESEVVKIFWIVGLIGSMIGLIYGVII